MIDNRIIEGEYKLLVAGRYIAHAQHVSIFEINSIYTYFINNLLHWVLFDILLFATGHEEQTNKHCQYWGVHYPI